MDECFGCNSEEPTVAVLPRAELHHGEKLCRSCQDVRDAIDFEVAERAAGKIGKAAANLGRTVTRQLV